MVRHLGRALTWLLLLPLPCLAQDLSGTYRLEGHQWLDWSTKAAVSARLQVELEPNGRYRVTRVHTYSADGHAGATLEGVARFHDGQLQIRYRLDQGLSDVLTGAGAQGVLTGAYTVLQDGSLKGSSQAVDRNGKLSTFWEAGARASDDADAGDGSLTDPGSGQESLAGLKPGGIYLVGQSIPLDAPGATAEGAAEITSGTLRFTAPGAVTVRSGSQEVVVKAVEVRIASIEVLDDIALEDAEPPHWRAPKGDETESSWEPALLLMEQKLRLRVILTAEANLSAPVRVTLAGSAGGLALSAKTTLDRLEGGQAVELQTDRPFSDGVRINALPFAWSVSDAEGQVELAGLGTTELRVYTTLAAPRVNPLPRHPDAKPVVTKLHLELACEWAGGAGENTDSGGDSICETIDNAFRHLVHPSDHGSTAPAIPHYVTGAAKPKNYDSLPAETGGRVVNGVRWPSSIFYPDEKKSYDAHYRQNYGWYVLENPTHVGGRCNQQASLIADIFGTVGVQAKVYYIQRLGRGRTSGKTMLRYYVSNLSGKSWNFHGVCQATLANGKPWLYDGSGSGPPDRINGSPDELLGVDGTFVKYWKPYWKYLDTKQKAPESDWPTEYIGNTGKLGKGQWKGVAIQESEEPLLPGQNN
jgi:hypothetical protein